MLINPLQARPQGLIGLLIMALSVLAFHAACNTYFPTLTSLLNHRHPTCTSPLRDQVTMDDFALRSIQTSISDLSNSLLQINASLTSLHAKIDSQTQHHPTTKSRGTNFQPAKSRLQRCSGLVSFIILIPFLGGIFMFLEDASHVSEEFFSHSILLLLGAANVGLVFMVFWRIYRNGMWYDYAFSVVWPIVISGFLISLGSSESNVKKLAMERQKVAKE